MQMQNQDTKCKVVYSLRIFIKLNDLGFQPKATMPNPNNNKLNCWVYEATPDFLAAFEALVGEVTA